MADVRVWHARLDVDSDLTREFETTLSDDERARAARFYFERDRRRFLVARGILRTILGSVLAVEPSRVRFRYGNRGKPYLDPEFDRRLFFNVAHSREHAMFAVAHNVDVGIDVEAIRPLDNLMALADRFFSANERIALRVLPHTARVTGFFQCWTRKEAYVKALGEGLVHPLDSFDVPIDVSANHRRVFADTPAEGWSLHDLSQLPDAAGAIVVRGSCSDVDVRQWTSDCRG